MHESGEMYLETIYVLGQKGDTVRSVDISDYMEFSKPSVSRAIGILKANGYIEVDRHGGITLTDAGKAVAQGIYERHTILTKILTHLGVDEEVAEKDACRMEHYISDTSFKAIKEYFEKFDMQGAVKQ